MNGRRRDRRHVKLSSAVCAMCWTCDTGSSASHARFQSQGTVASSLPLATGMQKVRRRLCSCTKWVSDCCGCWCWFKLSPCTTLPRQLKKNCATFCDSFGYCWPISTIFQFFLVHSVSHTTPLPSAHHAQRSHVNSRFSYNVLKISCRQFLGVIVNMPLLLTTSTVPQYNKG